MDGRSSGGRGPLRHLNKSTRRRCAHGTGLGHVLLFLAALSLLAVLTGCQGQQQSEPSVAQAQPAAPSQPEPAAPGEPEQPVQVPTAEATEGPKITFDAAVYDFGEVGPRARLAGRFEFVNSGAAPLEITEIKRCCGVVAKLADDKKVYAPGERGVLDIQYSSPSRPTVVARRMSVASNDPANPRVELTIKAKVVLKVDYEPKTVQVSLMEEDPVLPNLTLISIDDKPFSVTSLTSTNRCITASVDPNAEATQFVLPLDLDVAKLEGRTRGTIGLVLTHPECARLLIPFTAVTKYRAIPSHIYLLDAVPKQPVTRNLSVVSELDPDFEIESIETETGFVKVVKRQKTANGYSLELEITPPPRKGELRVYTDRLHVHVGRHDVAVNVRAIYSSQGAVQAVLRIGDSEPAVPREPDETVQAPPAQAVAAPKITFDAAVYDFGQVGPGTKQAGRFEFVNSGNGPLEITGIKRCCGIAAELVDDKKVYAPGERGVVEVRYYASSRPTSVARQFHVACNDPANPSVTLTIKANIVSKVAYEPERVKLLVADEDTLHPTITLTSIDQKPFSIKSAISTNRCISVDVDPALQSTRFTLPTEVDLEKLADRTNGIISLILTHPECTRLSIPFTVVQKYRAVPPAITVFNAAPAKSVTRSVSLISDFDSNFEIAKLESENGLVQVVDQKKITNGYRLELQIIPPPRKGNQSIYADVLHAHVGQHDVAVNIRAVYPEEPAQRNEAQGE